MKISLRQIPFFLLLWLFQQPASAQKGYDIRGKLSTIGDTTSYLVYYYGNQLLIKDTCQIRQGEFQFKGETLLPAGLYLIALKPTKVIELVIGNQQQMIVNADTSDIVGSISSEGSLETTLYYDYFKFFQEINHSFEKKLITEGIPLKETENPFFKKELQKVNNEIKKFQKRFFDKNADNLAAKILKATIEVEYPDPPYKKNNGDIDSLAMYRYGKNHFFDNIALNDNRLAYTPYIQRHIERYFKNMVAARADSVIAETDALLAKMPNAPTLRKQTLVWLSKQHEIPKNLGLDGVYTHLLEKYYIGEPSLWDSSTVRRAKEVFAIQQPLLIGKPIPDMVLADTLGNPLTIHRIQSLYTILYIYNPGCGACKASTPKLAKFYEKFQDRVKIILANIEPDEKKFREFIKTYHTQAMLNGWNGFGVVDFQRYNPVGYPAIYVLDKDKKILAKYLQVDQLDWFITTHEAEQKQANKQE